MLRLVAFALLPASLLAAIRPEWKELLALLPPVIVIIALADLIVLLRRRNNLTLSITPSITLVSGRSAELQVTAGSSDTRRLSVEIGMPLPRSFDLPFRQKFLDIPPGDQHVRFSWPVTGNRRGLFRLTECNVRLASPFRLWQLQRQIPVKCELKVYPSLRQERRRLAALFLERNERQIRSQRQRGQGREFEKLRLYQPGDSLGDIHWKSTAKRGQLVTKEFQIEKTQEIYLLLDASRLSGRLVQAADGSPEPFIEQSIRTAMILGSVASAQGDLFGVAAFGNSIRGFVRAKGGKQHLGHCMDMLYTLEPGEDNPSYTELSTFLAARLRRRALLIFIAPLDEPALAEEFISAVAILARRHLVCVAMPVPKAASPLFSDETAASSDDVYSRLAGHLVWQQLLELQQSLRLKGIRLFLVKNTSLTADLISHYLDVKRRQQL